MTDVTPCLFLFCASTAHRAIQGGRRPADAVPASLMVTVSGLGSPGVSTLAASVGIVAGLFVIRSEKRRPWRRGAAIVTAGVVGVMDVMSAGMEIERCAPFAARGIVTL